MWRGKQRPRDFVILWLSGKHPDNYTRGDEDTLGGRGCMNCRSSVVPSGCVIHGVNRGWGMMCARAFFFSFPLSPSSPSPPLPLLLLTCLEVQVLLLPTLLFFSSCSVVLFPLLLFFLLVLLVLLLPPTSPSSHCPLSSPSLLPSLSLLPLPSILPLPHPPPSVLVQWRRGGVGGAIFSAVLRGRLTFPHLISRFPTAVV